MSSFSDNFKKDSEEDQMEYDDSAFYYFSFSILSAILLPYTYSLLSSMCFGDYKVEEYPGQCKCTRCAAMIQIKKKQARSAVYTRSFYFKLIVGVFFGYLWYLNANMVTSMEALKSFDPFEIIGVDNDATIKDIKKEYRKKSLYMHPDKNPGNPLAVQEFIRLTKAYNILTDATAYDNFKKYGNPDGPGSYNVAIALPKFLLTPDNQIPVLLCAFFILLVVIPGFLYLNFGDTSIKDEQGVLLENKRIYGSKLNENLLVKSVPSILAQSIEFQSIGAKSKEEIALIKKLKDNEDIDELMPKIQSRNTKQMNIKPLVLILGYLMGDEGVKHPSFKEGLNAILRQGVHHLHMMIELAMQINMDARQGKSVKKLGWKALQSIIEFTQCFVQGLWTNNDPMLQLPGFDQDEIKAYRKKLREHQIPDGKIETFCRLSPEQRAKLGLFGGDKAKLGQLEKVIKALPLVTASYKVEVEGEETITASDVISFCISLKYDNLPEDQSPGYICSIAYPYLKRSNWYFVIVDAATKENVIQVERLQCDEGKNVCKFEMKQRFGRAGKFSFHCYLCNDSYIGFDKELSIEVDVLQDDPARVVEEYSQEDQEAVKGPNLVQSMMIDEEDDDESSDDNPEVLLKKLEAAGLKTPEAAKYEEAKRKAASKKKVSSELIE